MNDIWCNQINPKNRGWKHGIDSKEYKNASTKYRSTSRRYKVGRLTSKRLIWKCRLSLAPPQVGKPALEADLSCCKWDWSTQLCLDQPSENESCYELIQRHGRSCGRALESKMEPLAPKLLWLYSACSSFVSVYQNMVQYGFGYVRLIPILTAAWGGHLQAGFRRTWRQKLLVARPRNSWGYSSFNKFQ